MCGIFGYVGEKNNTAQTVLDGLKLLEYRGYDSWGVAIKKGKKFTVEKNTGKIGEATVTLPQSNIGIGHTRWATHGGVTVENAHPHLDCKMEIAVIHNGIIENFSELKAELVKKGHTFKSETDTEVFAHLVEEFLKKEGFTSAVRDAFNKLHGLNAIVVACCTSKEIVAVKTGSPLVIGQNHQGYFVASDVAGVLKHTKKVLFLKDREMAILGDNIQLLSLPEGKKLTPQFETINWKIEEAEKGKFKHFLIKEIYDQGKSIGNAANQNQKDFFDLVDLIKNSFGVYAVGCGTAGHACRMATYLFSVIAKKHLNFCVGSEFSYFEHFLTPDTLLIAASQSGETADILEAVAAAKNHKSKIVALVNITGSTLQRQSDMILPLKAGPEKAVLSTKAFTSKMTIFYLLAYAVAGKYEEGRAAILKTAKSVENLLADKKFVNKIKEVAKKISSSPNIYILGRGLSFPIALEAAHKIKEASYIHAEGFAGGEPKHCEISLISKGTPTVVFIPNDETKSAMLNNTIEFKSRGAYIIGISPENNVIFDEWIKVPDLGLTSSIVNIIPAQLLAYYLALEKGNDPDKPRNLAKSVTVK